jgi:hypothetical protein
MKIELKFLELAFQGIIEKLKFEKIETIEINDDLYKIIPTNHWSDFDNSDVVYTGSLNDDITALKSAVENDFITYVDLDRLASILRAISHENNPG